MSALLWTCCHTFSLRRRVPDPLHDLLHILADNGTQPLPAALPIPHKGKILPWNSRVSWSMVSRFPSADVRRSAGIASRREISASICALVTKSFPRSSSSSRRRSPVPWQNLINSSLLVLEKCRSRTRSPRLRLISFRFRLGA